MFFSDSRYLQILYAKKSVHLYITRFRILIDFCSFTYENAENHEYERHLPISFRMESNASIFKQSLFDAWKMCAVVRMSFLGR